MPLCVCVMYGCESWTVKKAKHRRTYAFELWCWRRLLRVPWAARRFNQSILKEISPGCSLDGLMLKLKLQYFVHLLRRVDSLEKTLMLGGTGGGRRRGWDGWMASLTRWTWVWVNSGRWWWTGRPGMLRFMGSQRVGHDWVTELNWCVWVCMLGYVCSFIICGDLGSHHSQGAALSPPDMVTPSGCTFIIHPTPVPKPWIPLISSPSLQFWECYINGPILCRTFWNCFFFSFSLSTIANTFWALLYARCPARSNGYG